MPWTITPKGVRFIGAWESFRSRPYYDESGYPTQGYGHLLSAIIHDPLNQWPDITQGQGEEWLTSDLAHFNEGVGNLVTAYGVAITQQQFDAFVSFSYNIGLSALRSSTLWRWHVAKRDADSIQTAFMMWDKDMQDGALVVSPGLRARRIAEAALYNWGKYGGPDGVVL